MDLHIQKVADRMGEKRGAGHPDEGNIFRLGCHELAVRTRLFDS